MELKATLFFFILVHTLFDFVTSSCSGIHDCKTCVTTKSWSDYCRWCPKDSKCHAHGSLENPCSRAENIHSPDQCDNVLSHYDAKLAHKMVLLSSAAYGKNGPQPCLDDALPMSQFKVIQTATAECDSTYPDNVCAGFVAVSNVEQAIVVSFRGTTGNLWQPLVQFLQKLGDPSDVFLKGHIEHYWFTGYSQLWPPLEQTVKQLIGNYSGYKVWVTGHSLGGAIASMVSTEIAYGNLVPRRNLIAYTFGMPRVGDYDYAYQHDQLLNNSWRVVNSNDPVPHYPPAVISILDGPYHHGVEAYYDASLQPDGFKECCGKPYNEDPGCSAGDDPSAFDLNRHLTYLGIDVAHVCNTIATPGGNKRVEQYPSPYSSHNVVKFKQDG